MSIALKDAVKIVTDAVAVISSRFPIKWEDIINKPTIDVTDFYTKEEINNRFPIKWEDIANKPTIDFTDLYTKEEVDKALNINKQLVSPDGTAWEPTIDNNGVVSWKKVTPNGQ